MYCIVQRQIMLVALLMLFTHNGAVIDTEQNFIKQYNHVCPMHQWWEYKANAHFYVSIKHMEFEFCNIPYLTYSFLKCDCHHIRW